VASWLVRSWPGKLCCVLGQDTLLSQRLSVGGVVASWLVHLSRDRAVRVRALVGDIALCFWARHLTLTVPLSTQVYKWGTGNFNAKVYPCDGLEFHSRGRRNTPSRFILSTETGISSDMVV